MRKFYLFLQIAFCVCTLIPTILKAQDCSSLSATAIGYESRCAATGSIKVFASGGTGSYKYKVIGPITSNFTSTDSITGLPPGAYLVVVNDIVSNCTFTIDEIDVDGNYQDPRFTLTNVNVSCDNGSNGTITVTGQQFGRPPFVYSIVAPSPMGVGTTNSTGVFTNLKAGDYSIRMTDSCGGIQTRQITVDNYTWQIDSYLFTKTSCNAANGYIKVIDSKGNISTVGGIPGFMYGVVRFPGDTIWSSSPDFSFDPLGAEKLDLVAKDACGKIKKASTSINFIPSVSASVNTYNNTCNSFSAALTSIKNFYNAEYCLYDNSNNLITCNATGTFTGLAYGSYCITAHDSCSDTTITRCFTETAPVISVSNTVTISNRNCNTFTASIIGKVGLTNPNFCLYDENNIQLSCNSTGVFDNLPYGQHCITVTDGCVDTTITRCFTTIRPRPVIPPVIDPGYTTCNNFGIKIPTDSLANPRFCLLDSLGVEIICNNTGVFDSIPFGNYCVNVYDSCYDTTIVRCFSVLTGYITNDITIHIDNKACSTFTLTALSSNILSGEYCLYNAADSLIGCNSFGVFDSIPYGSYCVKSRNFCPDTTFTNCFTAGPTVPSVNGSINISSKTCSKFKATVTGQQDLTDPQYCLYDNNDVQLSCNTTGVFDSLAYGSYCIKITNSCYDTVITKCFSAAPSPVSISVNAKKSCSYGYAKFSFTLTNATMPVSLYIYDPAGNLYFSGNYNNSSINIDSIPEVTGTNKYKVIVLDNCGGIDSLTTGAVASKLTHTPFVINKCPSASWLNGSGTIQATTSTNMGSLSVRIIKKNGATYSPYLNPNTSSGGVYTFNDLGPGTYIIRYKANDGCNEYLYDTVAIQTYQYPSLNRTSAYQCDVDGFTVTAVVDNGVGPFSYEIIGSTPSSPSIIVSPQASPVFNINNGTTYSLIRLRVLDACGNASLEDASILPLADNGIIATYNCFQIGSTLSVDEINNATYAWYKKDNYTSTDSILVGNGKSITIPNVLPVDTGIYSCHIVVNNGCIRRSYDYNLDGSCFKFLPVVLKDFSCKFTPGNVVALDWKVLQGSSVKKIVIERQNEHGVFLPIGNIDGNNSNILQQDYSFKDVKPYSGKNYYRLKLVTPDNNFIYSNTILALPYRDNNPGIIVYPNPARDLLTIEFSSLAGHSFRGQLLNSINQVVATFPAGNVNNGFVQLKRTQNMGNGLYIVRLYDTESNMVYSQKVIFR